MRAALITILPMFAAAILVMVGGERLSRREVETRTPADRGRLLDFDEVFRSELARLDAVYLSHLEALTAAALSQKPDEVSAQAKDIAGVRLIRIFPKKGKDLTIQPDWKTTNLPEIELSNGKRPLDSRKSVVLEAAMLDEPLPEKGKWLTTADASYLVHCRQPEPGRLVVFLIDRAMVEERTASHLATWLETPLTPLREAGGRLRIERPNSSPLVTLGAEQHGPAASIIPLRTNSGDWQIRSWDGLVVTQVRDPATLAVATTLAILLVISGVVLLLQQNRALKLAAERVSFVNRVSHELGTPLTNIALNLDLAAESISNRPDEARRRLGLVAEEIERLSRLVANVLTFSRRERNTLQLKPVRCVPAEVVGQTLDNFRPALERRGIEIEADLSAHQPVLIDPDALGQITGNLISNVEKYAASGKWLGLTCRMESDFLVVEVRDHGNGIPPSARQRIFDPFERVLESTNEGASGTGLGLSIGRDLARRMGGGFELLESDVGAFFRLRVPAPPAPPALAIVSETDAA
jgi:signal transduction histidine kinase